MISGFILLEIAATIALIYGFAKEDKIIEFEDQIIDKIKKAIYKWQKYPVILPGIIFFRAVNIRLYFFA